MNLPKKLYCRAFQLGLKIALPFLPYRTPRVIGSIKALPQVIKKNRCGKSHHGQCGGGRGALPEGRLRLHHRLWRRIQHGLRQGGGHLYREAGKAPGENGGDFEGAKKAAAFDCGSHHGGNGKRDHSGGGDYGR